MNWKPKKRTLYQMLFWGGLFVVLPLFLMSGFGFQLENWLARGLITFFGISLLVFVNLEVLVPKLYFKKSKIPYIFACLVLVCFLILVLYSEWLPWSKQFDFGLGKTFESFRKSRGLPPPDRFQNRFSFLRIIGRGVPFIFTILGSTLFEIATYANQKTKEAVQLRNEKLITEMKFLKSQINPHFLFNSLNNIYTLTVIKSDAAPENLLKLSDMLRYMLYDCKADRVPLKKEIKYIKDFIALNQLKDSRGLNVNVNLDESRPNLEVAPLIFVPFIENAFKHSKIEDLEKGWIKIDLKTEENSIHFSVKNSVPENEFSKDKIGGIGLENVKRQLELIYPEKHELIIHNTDNQFIIRLKIQA